jgi:hypothetical protein
MPGSKPGERRGGRQKGVPNKATADIKALAQQYAPEAVAELARLALNAESEPARVAAIKELLDRGFGKATQAVDLNANVRLGTSDTFAAFARALGGARTG